MAYLSCSFGSVIEGFPDGSAHFLEHRLFDFNGIDGTELFSQLGADVNAFTARRIIGFYFSTMKNHLKSIQLLTDLVLQKRYFDEKAIENEKKIIESEIMMVEDDPFAKGYQLLLEQLFWVHPVRLKIAGTKESISSINKNMLSKIHKKYFTPQSCKLIICGTEKPQKFLDKLSDNLDATNWNPSQLVKNPYYRKEPLEVKTREYDFKMPISKDLFFIGFKTKKKKLTLLDSLIGEFISHVIFGSISSFTDHLYSKCLIDDSFYFSYDWDVDYGYLLVAGFSSFSSNLRVQIEKEIKNRIDKGISKNEFDIIQHYFLGSTYIMIDKPGELMMHLTNLAWTQNKKWEDYLDSIQTLNFTLINKELKNFIDLNYSAVTLIRPL